MSGKFEKKKNKGNRRPTHRKRRSHMGWKVILSILALLILTLIGLAMLADGEDGGDQPETTTAAVGSEQASQNGGVQAPQNGAVLTPAEPTTFDLGNGLMITDLGAYTGIYMEDGSDELISGVMMIIVTNQGEQTLQYAGITLSSQSGDAVFTLSTLEPGASVVVLEAERRQYKEDDSFTEAKAENVVFFQEPLSVRDDLFEIQTLDGGFNITNVSGRDITGKIVIYYKYSSGSLYYGGITYRGSIEGGLAAGEVRQIMSPHFSASGTTVLYITVAEE